MWQKLSDWIAEKVEKIAKILKDMGKKT